MKCYIATRYDGFDSKDISYEFSCHGKIEFSESSSGIVAVRPWAPNRKHRPVDSEFSTIKAVRQGQETIRCRCEISSGGVKIPTELNISVTVM